MAHDHNDIYSIVERLRVLEEGLDKHQRSVNQLGATFKPKTVAVLTAKTDPKNPMAGKLVGSSESVDYDETAVAEDVLDKVKKSFADYLNNIADEIKTDTDLKNKPQEDTDLKNKDAKDRGLQAKDHPSRRRGDPEDDQQDLPSDLAYQRGESPYDTPERQTEESELDAAMSGEIPAEQPAGEPGVSMKESTAVKIVTNESGQWEVHGDELGGFEIRRAGRCLPTRFKTLDEAEMALEMFAHRQRRRDEAADYIDEA